MGARVGQLQTVVLTFTVDSINIWTLAVRVHSWLDRLLLNNSHGSHDFVISGVLTEGGGGCFFLVILDGSWTAG